MRYGLAILVALSAAAVPALGQNTDFYTPPIVSIPKVTKAPRIDGILEPGEWAQAATLSPFILLGGKGLPINATEVRMMYDDHDLYIGAMLYDPNPKGLKATIAHRDGPVWQDDSFELFFDTEGQRKSYIHLAVNPLGTQYDALGQDKSKDYRWIAATAVVKNGWSVELALPFANDVCPVNGATWGLSVARHCAGNGELSSWVRDRKTFSELDSMGSLVFQPNSLMMAVNNLGRLWLGDNTAQFTVRNPGLQAAACKINARVLGRDKRGSWFGATKLTLSPKLRQSQNVVYKIMQDGFSTATFSLTNATGKTVWRSAPYPITTPEVEPAIATTEESLAKATKTWMRLPASPDKQNLKADLDGLTVQWRYLVSQYRDRAKMQQAELQNLADFASKLQGEAEKMQRRVEAAETSGRADVSFGVTAIPSLTHVFPEELDQPQATSARLDACRDDSEAVQLVMLPFH